MLCAVRAHRLIPVGKVVAGATAPAVAAPSRARLQKSLLLLPLTLFLLLSVRGASALSWSPQAVFPPLVTNSTEGFVVALSADGNTLVVGSPGYNITGPSFSAGFVQVYLRTGTSWSHQATLSQDIGSANEGTSVTLSADGNLLAVGAPYSLHCGQVFIYMRVGQAWSYNATISPSCVPLGARLFGQSVSLSATGNVLAVGAPFSGTSETGWTLMYVQSTASWYQVAQLSQFAQYSTEAWSVSLSGDGTTLFAGCPNSMLLDVPIAGATFVYAMSGSSWQYVATLTQAQSFASEGTSVAASYDGNLVAVGAPYDSPSEYGMVYLYSRAGNSWFLNTTITSGYGVGFTVSLSGDGTSLATAGNHSYTTSALYSASTWNYAGLGSRATSVSMAANSNTLAVGNAGFGTAIWTFDL